MSTIDFRSWPIEWLRVGTTFGCVFVSYARYTMLHATPYQMLFHRVSILVLFAQIINHHVASAIYACSAKLLGPGWLSYVLINHIWKLYFEKHTGYHGLYRKYRVHYTRYVNLTSLSPSEGEGWRCLSHLLPPSPRGWERPSSGESEKMLSHNSGPMFPSGDRWQYPYVLILTPSIMVSRGVRNRN